jgi:DnaJ-like protein
MNTIARLVAWHRAPSSTALPWRNPMAPLPSDMQQLLQVANGDASAMALAKAATGAHADELRAAALQFIREVMLAPGASHYRKLGTEPDAPIERIRDHYRELISIFHPDRINAEARPGDADLAAVVNQAYNALKHPESRARYDRLQSARASKASPVSQPSPSPRKPPRPGTVPARSDARRPQWKVDEQASPMRLWFQARSPGTLKAMALAGVLVVAVVAVLLTGERQTTTLAATPNDAAPQFKPTTLPDTAILPRDTALVALLDHSGSHGAGGEPGGVVRAHEVGVANIRIPPALAAPSLPRSPSQGAPGSDPPPDAIARSLTAVSAPLPSMLFPLERSVAVAPSTMTAARPAVIVEPPPPVTGPAVANTPATPVLQVATAPIAVIELPVAALAGVAPSAAEVDALVARFARAYDAGDLPALLALIDPDVVQDDRIAFTFANFSRVFRETSSRRIELQVVQRAAEQDRARIQLDARTTLNDKDSGVRAGAGELMLVVRKRGGVPVIMDVRYRESGAAA